MLYVVQEYHGAIILLQYPRHHRMVPASLKPEQLNLDFGAELGWSGCRTGEIAGVRNLRFPSRCTHAPRARDETWRQAQIDAIVNLRIESAPDAWDAVNIGAVAYLRTKLEDEAARLKHRFLRHLIRIVKLQ